MEAGNVNSTSGKKESLQNRTDRVIDFGVINCFSRLHVTDVVSAHGDFWFLESVPDFKRFPKH